MTTVLSEIESSVRTITLNRPERLNAMNRQLIAELAEAVEAANREEATKVIILTGAGRAFCAGDDLDEHAQPNAEAAAREHVDAIQRVSRAMLFGDKPIIGAINGWAVGGGLEWAINCDFPIWAESAKGFFPELKWGMFVTGGVTSLLPALTGLHKAREMMILGAGDGRRLARRARRRSHERSTQGRRKAARSFATLAQGHETRPQSGGGHRYREVAGA
jgi:enoyl-CoA hydratase/carnithine racemase